MKKIIIVAATAGLMSLAACQPAANNSAAVDNGSEANASSYNSTETTTMTNVDTAMPTGNATTATMSNTTETMTNTTAVSNTH